MNKKNILLLIISVVLFSGCTATYDLEFYNKQLIENVEFIESNTFLLDKQYDLDLEYKKYTYRGLIEEQLTTNISAFIDNESAYYEKEKITKNNDLGISFKYEFDEKEYSKSFAANLAYKYFNFIENEDTYMISTNKENTIFEQYKYLDKLTIHLKTNHKVKDTNADKIDGYNYYWYVDRNNAMDSTIYIELYKDKYVFNYEGKLTKILYISIGLAILIIIAIIFFKRKATNNNRV